MSISKKLKWNRSLSRLRYLYDELEYVKTISKETSIDFESYYRTFCAKNNIDINSLDRQNRHRLDKLYGCDQIAEIQTGSESDIDSSGNNAIAHFKGPPTEDKQYTMSADDIVIHEAFVKLFKKIALKIHPDKIDKNLSQPEVESRINMFQKSNQALEDKKYYILLDVADQFNISTPKDYERQTRWMKNEATKVIEKIEKEKNTYNYGFHECETDQQKEELIKRFIFQLFKVQV